MAERLGSYRAKRDLEASPEPDETPAHGAREDGAPDDAAPDDGAERQRFVIHEHHARRLHWDLRLERDGVLVSWAVPKGIPADPKRNHLAVHVEDHPLSYIDFAGEIPKGSYGAGKVAIWDSGTYECHKFRDDEVILTFHGERASGRYALFQTRGDDWMIHRMDPPADPGRQPIPERVRPMLARTAPLPSDDAAYGHEIKWDGVRAVLYADGGQIRLETRNGKDVTARYPELRELGRALGSRDAVLDGEVVALDEDGRPNFGRLQQRMHLASDSAVRRRMRDVPVIYMIFDLLYLGGRSTIALPYAERRRLLDELCLAGDHWRTPAHHAGEGKAMLEASRKQGLEGVVAKRLDSAYEPGRRSGAWIKVKNQRRQDFVVGGWTRGEGNRRGRLGALLVGYNDATPDAARERGEPQRLVYAGSVGSGFKEQDLVRLSRLLGDSERDTSPFGGRQPARGATFVEPRLVAEVEFSELTRTRTLRHPSFKGLRDDKDPADVVLEETFVPRSGETR